MLENDRDYRTMPMVPTGWRRNGVIGITATVLMTGGLLLAAATTDGAHAATVGTSAKEYKNCTELNQVYPHGDKIACEKR
ncbi:hypothetical protein [Sporichthya sp.]|uniref:hypothetical protein n=1 Tax=Sporichthya sp. TaxID=65475 RepID=UPI00181536CB|nr:hypothetical protein [Sporichthya sp.]MBA3744010.1 hypothetical protein [Sporichthya sp.]